MFFIELVIRSVSAETFAKRHAKTSVIKYADDMTIVITENHCFQCSFLVGHGLCFSPVFLNSKRTFYIIHGNTDCTQCDILNVAERRRLLAMRHGLTSIHWFPYSRIGAKG